MVAACPLREVTHWVSNHSARTKTVTLAALHESVGGTEAVGLADFTQRAGVSYHAIADNDKLVYTVPRSRTAWHIRNGNARADGLCLCTPVAGYSRDQWLGPQLNKVKVAGWWLALVCADRGLDLAQCSYADIRAALAGDRAAGGTATHNDYTQATRDGTHTDPRNFPVDVAIQYARQYAGTAPTPASAPQRKVLDMPERAFGTGNTNGRFVCPTGSASAVVARTWLSASVDGSCRIEVWAQKSGGGNVAAGSAETSKAYRDWTLRPGDRGWFELPDGTEMVTWHVTNSTGAGAVALEQQPK